MAGFFTRRSIPSRRVGDRLAQCGEVSHSVRAVADTERPVQVFLDQHAAAGQGGSPARRRNLPNMVGELDRVVVGDSALLLDGKDAIQIRSMNRSERRSCLSGSDHELAIELADVVIPQKRVGLLGRVELLQPQLLGKPSLPSPKVAFASSSSLRRVGGYHPDTQISHRPSDFGHLPGIDRLPRLGCAEEVTGAIAVDRTEPPLRLDTLRNAAITVRVDSSATNCA